MNAQSFGHLFGILFKRIDQRLFFIPKKLRKLVMIILSFVGLPLFLLFFLVLRGWLYRKVSLYEKGESQEIIEELQDINQRLDKYRKYDDNIIGSGNGTGNGINF